MPAPARQQEMARISLLDGWRGVAILLVLFDHLQPHTLAGSVYKGFDYLGVHGVALFFVLSGYLITGKLWGEFRQSGRLDLAAFYTRRAFRLMPCAWAYLLFLAVCRVLTTREALGCVFFFRNFITVRTSALSNHYWSLSIEEQFYLLWPLLLWMLLRRSGPRMAFGVAALAACALAIWRFWAHGQLSTEPITATFATQFHADALLLGCASAFVPRRFASTPVVRMAIAPVLAALILCILELRRTVPMYESLLIAFLIWGTSSARFPVISRALEFRPLVQLGVISYSIYIWQQPAACILGEPLWSSAVKLAAVIFVGVLSYYGLELPIRERGKRIVHGWRSLPRITSEPLLNES